MLTIGKREIIDEELGKLINSEFTKFADKNGVACDYSEFCFAAEENNIVIGVVTGHSYYKEVHISDLIVLEQYRGKNIGRRLIDAVENHFENRGFKHMNLSTYNFQAHEFYRKCGFQIEFVREDAINPKLTKYFFVKYF